MLCSLPLTTKSETHTTANGGGAKRNAGEHFPSVSLSLSAACAAAATRGAPFEKAEEAEELACDFISSALSK